MTREEQIKAAAKETTGLFSYRNGYSTTEDAFIAGAEWADKYVNYDSEVMFRLPNGTIEICTIEKLIAMHNNLLMIVESRTVAGAFRRLDKAVCDWKDSVRGSLSSLTTRFIRKTNNETAE